MKKFSFILAMVLATSFAMAQKITTIIQSGTSNWADVTQVAAFDDNSIFATQSGNLNELTTNQTGWNNYLELAQTGNGNTASMKQKTMDDGVLVYGHNTAKVLQQGNLNGATLDQSEVTGGANDGHLLFITLPEWDRSINYADATQTGNNNNYKLTQGSQVYIPQNYSALTQKGNKNVADLDQTGIKNYSIVKQYDTWNYANLFQTGGRYLPAATFDDSYSEQYGSGNSIDILQIGAVDRQYAESYQDGSNNLTKIKQLGDVPQRVFAVQAGTADGLVVSQFDVDM